MDDTSMTDAGIQTMLKQAEEIFAGRIAVLEAENARLREALQRAESMVRYVLEEVIVPAVAKP